MLENIKTEFDGCFREITVDDTGKIIRNAALAGLVSRNHRRYTKEALSGGASRYNGVRVYIDHPSKEDERQGWRSVRDLAGQIENARFDGSKVRGDIKLLNNDGGKLTYEIATNMPNIAGMSHNAFGKYHRENGEEVIESIERVVSVDVVIEPATNDGFFEAYQKQTDMNPKQIAEALKWPALSNEGVIIENECINTEAEDIIENKDAEDIARGLKNGK